MPVANLIMKQKFDYATNIVQKFTCPIVARIDGKIISFGSSILLVSEKSHYLITAGHVLNKENIPRAILPLFDDKVVDIKI